MPGDKKPMFVAKRASALHHHPLPAPAPAPVEEEEASGKRIFLKVYLSAQEKAAFEEEARQHSPGGSQRRPDASAYARFILGARKDPLLFLQYCRLRDPSFAAGLMGNPQDAGRVAELEKRVLELTRERDDATRDRDDAEKHAADLERRLTDATERAQSLAGYVVDLARTDQGNRERAMSAGAEVEAIPRPTLLIVKALSVSAGLRRPELVERLMSEGLTEVEAGDAIKGASRLDLITKGKDMRYRLAKQPEPMEEVA